MTRVTKVVIQFGILSDNMMREQEIERQFDIKINSMKPNKGVYLLDTNKGNKCLKKVAYKEEKLLFVTGAKEHLISQGFSYVDKNDISIEQKPYAIVNEDLYTLSEWIQGRECEYSNSEDIILASRALANLHEKSKGYIPCEESRNKSDLGRWLTLMEKRTKSFDRMREIARRKKNKSSFDICYLNNYLEYKKIAQEAKGILEESDYYHLCNIAEEEKSFCHHDYTHHNIIIDENNEVNVIDFDYCKREVRAYDIANFITKTLKRLNWNIEEAKIILDNYNYVSKLKEEEYKVIYAFLMFPQRFWRISNRAYYSEGNFTQKIYNKKIENLVSEFEDYKKFLEDFKNNYNIY